MNPIIITLILISVSINAAFVFTSITDDFVVEPKKDDFVVEPKKDNFTFEEYSRENGWWKNTGTFNMICPIENEFVIIINDAESHYKCERLEDPIIDKFIGTTLIVVEYDLEIISKNPYYKDLVEFVYDKKPNDLEIHSVEIYYNTDTNENARFPVGMYQWKVSYQDPITFYRTVEYTERTGLTHCQEKGLSHWYTYFENGTKRGSFCI